MSTRAIRKFLAEKESLAAQLKAEEDELVSTDEDEELSYERETKPSFNYFSALLSENEEEQYNDNENERDEEQELEESLQPSSVDIPKIKKSQSKSSKKKKTTKSKRKQPKQPFHENQSADDEALTIDIDLSSFDRLGKIDKTDINNSSAMMAPDSENNIENIICLNRKYFDFEGELRRVYGVSSTSSLTSTNNDEAFSSQGDGLSNRMRKRVSQHTRRLTSSSTSQIKYDLLPRVPVDYKKISIRANAIYLRTDVSLKNPNVSCGYFSHGPSYQSIEFEFFEALLSHSLEPIQQILVKAPDHLNSLIVLSDIFQHMGQYPAALNCVQKALFVIEFSIRQSKCPDWTLFGKGWSRRILSYDIYENRIVHGSIHRMIDLIGRQGAWRSALEFAIFLWSLEPEIDPLGILYTIDILALRSEQLSFLWEKYPSLYESKKRSYEGRIFYPPTYYYSLAWAKYKYYLDRKSEREKKTMNAQSENNVDEDLKSVAAILLKDAISVYPLFIYFIMEKGIIHDDCISSSKFMETITNRVLFYKENTSHPLYLLGLLYMEKGGDLWKIPDFNSWLREILIEMVTKDPEFSFDWSNQNVDDEDQQEEMSYWDQENPRLINLYRHLSLYSNQSTIKFSYPYRYRNISFHKHDPLPPIPSFYATEAYKECFEKENAIFSNDRHENRSRALEIRLRDGMGQITNWLRSLWGPTTSETANDNSISTSTSVDLGDIDDIQDEEGDNFIENDIDSYASSSNEENNE